MVAAASYEARPYGVRSAMPSMRAYRLCPDIVLVPPRFDHYRQISQHIRDILCQYTDLVEPLALDEAYLDVTSNKKGNPPATHLAQAIRAQIWAETGLTASAGVSMNKFLKTSPHYQRDVEQIYPMFEHVHETFHRPSP